LGTCPSRIFLTEAALVSAPKRRSPVNASQITAEAAKMSVRLSTGILREVRVQALDGDRPREACRPQREQRPPWYRYSMGRLALYALCLCLAAGCQAITGVDQLEETDGAGSDGSMVDATLGIPETSSDGPRDASIDTAETSARDGGSDSKATDVADASPPQPTVIASGQSSPTYLAVDATNVYWANHVPGGQVMKARLAGGPPTVIADMQDSPFAVAVDSSNVYFTGLTTALVSVPIDGGATILLQGGTNSSLRRVIIATGAAYWTNATAGLVWTVGLDAGVDGGGSSTLVTGQSTPAGIVSDVASLYWVNQGDGTVRSATQHGGSLTTLATGAGGPDFLDVDATHVYWTATAGGEVRSVPKTGGPSTLLASQQSSPCGVAVDAANVYWANQGDGTIRRAPVGGGVVTTVASGQSDPTGLTLDATHLYWTNPMGGTVVSLPK
jgi:hypothetical protein